MVLHHQFHGLPPLVFMLPVSFAILGIYATSFMFCPPWCLCQFHLSNLLFVLPISFFAALDIVQPFSFFASLGVCACLCQVLALLTSFCAANDAAQ